MVSKEVYLALLGILFIVAAHCHHATVQEEMDRLEVVPDVIDVAPEHTLEVDYNGNKVHPGHELTPTQVKDEPKLKWEADSDALYTLAFVDPDLPSRTDNSQGEFDHWLVVNIPENQVNQGDTIAAYVGSGPSDGSGLHRYTFLVYKQPASLVVTETRASNKSTAGRAGFKIKDFATKYNLGNPIAGNLFQAQYDDYVPTLMAQFTEDP